MEQYKLHFNKIGLCTLDLLPIPLAGTSPGPVWQHHDNHAHSGSSSSPQLHVSSAHGSLVYIYTCLNALNFLSGDHHSSFITCDIQLFLFIILVKAECLLLAVMTYDCNMAICNPLYYPILMLLVVGMSPVLVFWETLLNTIIHVFYTLTLHHSVSREAQHLHVC